MDNEIYKNCFKCGELKPLSEYYTHKQTSDGHIGKCKSCTKADSAKRLAEKRNDPEWAFNERSRKRRTNRTCRKSRTKEDKTSPKYGARLAAQRIPKKDGHQNHHWSYREEHWKDIIQLETNDHYKVHRFMIYDSERLQYRTIHGVLLDTKESAEHYYSKVLSIKDGVYSELEKLK